MNWNKHSTLSGKHAVIGASKCTWLNKTPDEIITSYYNSYATEIGSAMHEIAENFIKSGLKFKKSYKPVILMMIVNYYHIPIHALALFDTDPVVWDNYENYINDAIKYKMEPEVVLYYSDNCFGTADAILFDPANGYLRIHDLKTGKTTVHMEQLQIYAALFCLEYDVNPRDINIDLCIYQLGQKIELRPDSEDICVIAQKIVDADAAINQTKIG